MGKGFIRKPTDVKSLILYSLSQLPYSLDESYFFDYVHVDDGFDYFDFSQAVEELLNAKLIAAVNTKNGRSFIITPLGSETNETMSQYISAGVKHKADKNAILLARKIQRERSILTTHSLDASNGTYNVHIAITDKGTELFSVNLVLYSEEQCSMVENNFKKDAERLYSSSLDILCGINDPEDKI